MEGAQKLPGETNYLLGNDRSGGEHTFHISRRVNASTTIPGVAMVVYGNAGGSNTICASRPVLDTSKFRLDLSGAQKLSLDDRGNLLIGVGRSEIRMMRPAIYQETPAHARTPVAGRIRNRGG